MIMANRYFDNLIVAPVSVPQADIDFLKSKGINRSNFMRQAIAAFRENKFDYDYNKK